MMKARGVKILVINTGFRQAQGDDIMKEVKSKLKTQLLYLEKWNSL